MDADRVARRWRWLCFAAVAALVTVGACYPSRGEARPGVVVAQRLILRDRGGVDRIIMEVGDDDVPRIEVSGAQPGGRPGQRRWWQVEVGPDGKVTTRATP